MIGSTHIVLVGYRIASFTLRQRRSSVSIVRVEQRHSQSRAGTAFGGGVADPKLSHHSIITGGVLRLKPWVVSVATDRDLPHEMSSACNRR